MWLKVDDKLPTHPKFVGLDPRAGWLWFTALCFCGQHLTDGRLPRHVAQGLAATVDAQQGLLEGEHPLITTLVSRRLWSRTKTGYRVHDYLVYNPSAKEVRARQEAASRAAAAGGRIRAKQAIRRRGRFAPAGQPAAYQRRTSRATSGAPSGHFTSAPAARPDPIRPDPIRPLDSVVPPEESGGTTDTVAHLVDKFRAIPGVAASPKDGGLIAGLVKRHGAVHVEACLHEADVEIGAATNPGQYLAGVCRRPRRGATTLEDDKAQTIREFAEFRAEGRL